jgi:hypothetical protein
VLGAVIGAEMGWDDVVEHHLSELSLACFVLLLSVSPKWAASHRWGIGKQPCVRFNHGEQLAHALGLLCIPEKGARYSKDELVCQRLILALCVLVAIGGRMLRLLAFNWIICLLE